LKWSGGTRWRRWWRTPAAASLAECAGPFSVLALPGTGVVPACQLSATPSPSPGSLYTQGLLPVFDSGNHSARDNPRGPAGELGPRNERTYRCDPGTP
jgi:hypothetical protein